MGSKVLIIVAAAFLTTRLTGFFLAGNVVQLMFSFWLVAPFYSLYTSVMVNYINELAPRNTKAFAQTVLQSVSVGAGGMIGNFFGGKFIDAFGLRTFYGCNILLVLAAVLIFILPQLSVVIKKRKEMIKYEL
jgi:MFS family permease